MKSKDLCWEFAFTFHPPKISPTSTLQKTPPISQCPRQHSWQPFCQPCASLWILGKKGDITGGPICWVGTGQKNHALFRERHGFLGVARVFWFFFEYGVNVIPIYTTLIWFQLRRVPQLNQFQMVFLIDLTQIPSSNCKDVHLFTQVNRLLVKRMTVGQAAVSVSKWQIQIATLMMWALFATWHVLAGMEWNDYVLGGKLLLDYLPNQHATWKHKTSLVKDNNLGMETALFDPRFFATQNNSTDF